MHVLLLGGILWKAVSKTGWDQAAGLHMSGEWCQLQELLKDSCIQLGGGQHFVDWQTLEVSGNNTHSKEVQRWGMVVACSWFLTWIPHKLEQCLKICEWKWQKLQPKSYHSCRCLCGEAALDHSVQGGVLLKRDKLGQLGFSPRIAHGTRNAAGYEIYSRWTHFL